MNVNKLIRIQLLVVIIFIWILLSPLTPHVVKAASQTESAQANIHLVCPAGPPACDFASVQEAVDTAVDGDLIKVAQGSYTGVLPRPAPAGYEGPAATSQLVYLTKSVTIRGGYTTSNWTVSDPLANPTTLDAQGQGRVMLIASEITPVIEGLQFTGGDATDLGGTLWADAGGGIYVLQASATINGCLIYENVAASTFSGTGGGLFLASSSAAVHDNTIRNNVASTVGEGYGGGLALDNSPASIVHNVIVNNIASSGDWGYGGGVDLFASDAVLSANEIYGNSASTASQGFGGGLRAEGSAPEISGNTIRDNTASTVDDGYGGGMHLREAGGVIQGNNFDGNVATTGSSNFGYGGGLDLLQSDVTLSRNIIQDNIANKGQWGYGGGLNLSDSEGQFVNNVVIDNQAGGLGAGLYISGKAPTLIHTTIARNWGGDGSGLYLSGDTAVTLTNTILTGQTTAVHAEAGSSAQLNGVLWYGNSNDKNGGGVINETSAAHGDPLFAGDGYHILDGSAALDAGIDAGLDEDIDRQSRPYLLPDLGADEKWPVDQPFQLFLPLILGN